MEKINMFERSCKANIYWATGMFCNAKTYNRFSSDFYNLVNEIVCYTMKVIYKKRVTNDQI